ncbi:hypothetical protein AMATHDRAFT_135703, partial [Amanita thiersii Skay4041]
HKYKFDVKMTCSGCSGAITRVLDKAKTEGGVSSFEVDLGTQMVTVVGSMPYDDVLSRIKKTGKEVWSSFCLLIYITADNGYRSALARSFPEYTWFYVKYKG